MRSTISRLLLQIACLAILAAGCAAGDADATWTVVDDARVPIVRSTRSTGEADAWRVSADPVIDVGRRESAISGDLLESVIDVARFRDGIIVANMGDNTVRRYDAAGRLVWQVGGSGRGPGEYGQVWRLRVIGDEILAIQSRSFWPDYRYDAGGTLIQTIRKPALAMDRVVGLADVFADGSTLYIDWPQGVPVKADRWTDSSTAFRLSADGSRLDSITRMPALTFTRFDQRRGQPIVFGPTLTLAAGDSLVYASFPDRFEIAEYDLAGRLVRVIRRDALPSPISDEDTDRYRREFVNAPGETGTPIPQPLRAQRERIVAGSTFAGTWPAHGRMLADRIGNLWVDRKLYRFGGSHGFNPVYDDVTSWDVFDPAGVWLGSVEMPARFCVLEIGPDWVAGVWRDDADVEHARVYGIVKNPR